MTIQNKIPPFFGQTEEFTEYFNSIVIPTINNNAVRITTNQVQTIQNLLATDLIQHGPEAIVYPVAGSGGAKTLTSIPTISNGIDGETIYLVGTSDTNTVTLQDSTELTGSNLHLLNQRTTLAKGDVSLLQYSVTNGYWQEVANTNILETNVAMKEPTGFENRTDSAWTFTDGTRKLEVTTTNGYTIWFHGTKKRITTTKDITIADTEGIHAIYFDNTGTLQEYVNPTTANLSDLMTNECWVAYIYWDATNNVGVYVGEERHGCVMDGITHFYLHYTRGLQYVSGLALGDFVIGDGSLATHAQFSIATGSVSDEDIGITVSAIGATTGCPILYRSGATGDWRTATQAGYSVYQAGTATARLYYNQLTGGAWQLTEVDEGNYLCCHIFATTGKVTQMYSIMGQTEYTTLPAAKLGAITEMASIQIGDLPSAEIRPIATVLFQTDKDYGNAINARVVEPETGVNYIDWRTNDLPRGVAPTDHGSLSGLLDDDHTQYVLTSGTRSITQEAWIEVSGGVGFENSWVNFGGAYGTAGYFKDSLGIVHLKGLVKSGTIGAIIFTLPSGYRPSADCLLPGVSNSVFGVIYLSTAGAVAYTSGDNGWASLEGITFRAA